MELDAEKQKLADERAALRKAKANQAREASLKEERKRRRRSASSRQASRRPLLLFHIFAGIKKDKLELDRERFDEAAQRDT